MGRSHISVCPMEYLVFGLAMLCIAAYASSRR
jgi:hypothetical protein